MKDRETTNKNVELESIMAKLKKQNEQLRADNIKLVEALESEKKKKEMIGNFQDPDSFKRNKQNDNGRSFSVLK